MIKQENVAIVTLKKGEGRTIKAGGAWVLMVIRWEKGISTRIPKFVCAF